MPATISPYVMQGIGARACRRYFQTGERFSAERGQELGLISELVDEDESESPAESDDDQDSEGPSLMSEAARHAMRDNLATLALLSEPGSPPQIVRSGETSLEGLVREMLRPMLAEWLDKNLPPMVEELVRQEIARIVKKQG